MTAPSPQTENLRVLAEAGDVAGFLKEAGRLHPSDLAQVFGELDAELRFRMIQALPAQVVSEALAEMQDAAHPEQVLAALPLRQAADIVDHLPDNDAVDLLAELPPEQASRILGHVARRADVERLLAYGEETAGRLMTTAVIGVPATATAAEALEEIRRQAAQDEELYQVYGVDGDGRLLGVLPLQRLVVSAPGRPVREIMEPPAVTVPPHMDQEEVARLMARYNVAAVPVTDGAGQLLGRVTFDDVIDVVEAEGTEDLLQFGGVSGHEQLAAAWPQAVRSRLPWLFANTLTAFLAALVVWAFQSTIDAVVLLAVFMPIVAGQGGNAGTQALAVTIRRIALGLIPQGQELAVIRKEILVGLVNGLAVGLAVGVVAAWVGGTPMLGTVVALAMWGNLAVAGLVGSVVPLVLQRWGADPAVASSMFVTPVTDAVGFLLLLGLASWALL